MKAIYSFALLLIVYSGVGSVVFAAEPFAGPVSATVERVVDGDTVRVEAQIWLDQAVSIAVRLDGVDAPELFRPKCAAEKAAARSAKDFVE